MIKSINATGKYSMAMNAQAPHMYMNHHTGLQGIGNVRYNTVTNQFEVFDGNMWMQLSMAHAQVGLTPEAESILDWAKKKQAEEQRIMRLAEQHPGIRDLQEKLDVMIALVTKDKENDSQ
jgi:hypothetical protein